MQILVLDNNTAREAYPRPRQVMTESPPAFTSQRNMQVPRVQEDSRVTQDKNELKREIYNPGPKRLTKRVSLYYRDRLAKDSLDKLEKEVDEEGKRCAICLDDFEAGQEVMLTPCNHMFHEDCITPWMKSHSQCPVCRYEFGEQTREHASNFNNNNIGSDLITRELLSIARAMQEAFLWGNGPH